MTTAQFRVVHAGPLVTFQDGGRPGHMRFGVCASGPMDRVSFTSANLAVGNPQMETVVEVSMGGLVLECLSGTVTMAVAGGEFQLEINGRKSKSGKVFTLRAGETLSIRPNRFGNWCYLSFAGVVSAKKWLGHTATHAPSGSGGGALISGQEICVQNCRVFDHKEGRIPQFSSGSPGRYFRVVLGPQDQHFSSAAKNLLLSSEFSLSDAYDRMGVRLNGPALLAGESLSIPSEPLLKGSIQVSGEGVPTVLLADHQTTGGYPKIATLISTDIDDFVQMRVREQFRFKAINPENAIILARTRSIELRSYFKMIDQSQSAQ